MLRRCSLSFAVLLSSAQLSSAQLSSARLSSAQLSLPRSPVSLAADDRHTRLTILRRGGIIIALAAAYVVTARIGQQLAIDPGNVTPVWIPSGIILAAVLWYGHWVWPGIFIGACLGNGWAYFDFTSVERGALTTLSAIANGTGDSLCALLGAWGLRRFQQATDAFISPKGLVAFIIFAVCAGSLVSAVFGVGGLALAGVIEWSAAPEVFANWSVGDAVGVLLITPALVLGRQCLTKHSLKDLTPEGIALILTAGTTASLLVIGHDYRLVITITGFLFVPMLLWSVFRFHPACTALLLVVAPAALIVATAIGHAHNPNYLIGIAELQAMIGVVTMSIWFTSASWSERQRLLEDLEQHRHELTNAVATTRSDLQIANEALSSGEVERQDLVAAVAQSDRTLLSVIAHLPDTYIALIDQNMTVLLAGGGALRDRNLDPELFKGLAVADVFAPYGEAVVNTVLGHYREAFAGHDQSFDLFIDNEHQAYQAVPLPQASGEITRILAVARNVSRERRIEQQVRQAQKLRAVGSLTGGIAHEFNNVLTPIRGFAEVASASTAVDATCANALQQIIKATDRAAGLIDQMQIYAGPEHAAVDYANVDLAELIEQVVQFLKVATKPDVVVRKEIDQTVPEVLGNSDQLHQVLLNLCINANQAMGDQGTLSIGLQRCNQSASDWICLTVSDTGCGIPDTVLPQIFDPFFTTKDAGDGTGLGLAVVDTIVNQHRGTISVSSRTSADATESSGTSFEIRLPAARASAIRPSAPAEAIDAATALNLVALDDDPMVLPVVIELAERLGHQVRAFDDPGDALSAILAEPAVVDMVLTDYRMPGINGLQLVTKLRERGYTGPVVLISGDEEIAEQCRTDPGLTWLSKPFSGSELGQAISQARATDTAESEPA